MRSSIRSALLAAALIVAAIGYRGQEEKAAGHREHREACKKDVGAKSGNKEGSDPAGFVKPEQNSAPCKERKAGQPSIEECGHELRIKPR